MGILKLDVAVGQAVQIGPDVCVRVDEKQGQRVKLAIAALRHIAPIKIIATGLFPPHLTTGVTGEEIPVPDPRGLRNRDPVATA